MYLMDHHIKVSMVIETDRLKLTDYQLADIDDIYVLKSCKEVWKYSTFVPLKVKKDAEPLLAKLINNSNKGEFVYMALRRKDTDEFIGEAGII